MSDLETGASAEKRARLARLLSTRATRPRRQSRRGPTHPRVARSRAAPR